jgi:hypothetical protein
MNRIEFLRLAAFVSNSHESTIRRSFLIESFAEHPLVAWRWPKSTGLQKFLQESFSAQFGKSSRKKTPFWLLASQLECLLIRIPRLGRLSQLPAKIGPRRMGQMVVGQFPPGENRID